MSEDDVRFATFVLPLRQLDPWLENYTQSCRMSSAAMVYLPMRESVNTRSSGRTIKVVANH